MRQDFEHFSLKELGSDVFSFLAFSLIIIVGMIVLSILIVTGHN